MAWPTTAEIQQQFEKLNTSSLATYKIPQARLWAISIVKGWMGRCYSASTISGWDTSTPELLKGICFMLAYGWFAPRVHTGKDVTPTDQAASDARKEAMDMLRDICPRGVLELYDPTSASLIARSSPYASNIVHKRTESDTLSMDAYESIEPDTVDPDDVWEP